MTTLRTLADLAEHGIPVDGDEEAMAQVATRFAIAITPEMKALIDRSDKRDPVALQFVPSQRELAADADARTDPLGEAERTPVPGLVHRYPDRVLLKLTHTCPVYCRFCFRREVVGPGGEPPLTGTRLQAAIDYIRERPGIFEVILTGGDPLVLSPRRIEEVTSSLLAIPHVAVLRWHSRVPVVDPSRVSGELLAALRAPGKAVYVVVHANHPRELTTAAQEACARLVDGGIPLLSQSVLLKGVNDNVDTLTELMRGFVRLRIKPYYLHHLDLAPGTAHFRTTIAQGQALMSALRGRVSGLAQPTYVLDIPGGAGKVPIGPQYLSEGVVRDPNGDLHAYPDRG